MVSVSVIYCYAISHLKPTELVEYQSFILLKICKFCRVHLTGQLVCARWYELGRHNWEKEDSLSKWVAYMAGKLAMTENWANAMGCWSCLFFMDCLGFPLTNWLDSESGHSKRTMWKLYHFYYLALEVPIITYTNSPKSCHFMANRWGNNENSERLYLFGLQNHFRWWLQPWN